MSNKDVFCVEWFDFPETDLEYLASTLELAKEYISDRLPACGSAEGFRVYMMKVDEVGLGFVYEVRKP
jgi:hypothetical protein